MNKIIAIMLMYFVVSSCSNQGRNTAIGSSAATTNTQHYRDSIALNERADEIVKDGLYEFDKDTTRKEWIASHPYMCYQSSNYITETNGYDKNGNRVTNQMLTHEGQNTICVSRRKRTIIWTSYLNGKQNISELPIKQIDEYRKETSFGVIDGKGEKYVFNVPDDGKKVSLLTYDRTIVFLVEQ